jgi:hypothetical protein
LRGGTRRRVRGRRDDEPSDLYEVIRQRYEHGSIIITLN